MVFESFQRYLQTAFDEFQMVQAGPSVATSAVATAVRSKNSVGERSCISSSIS